MTRRLTLADLVIVASYFLAVAARFMFKAVAPMEIALFMAVLWQQAHRHRALGTLVVAVVAHTAEKLARYRISPRG